MAYAHINSRATLAAAVLGSAFALCSVMQSARAADAGDEAREGLTAFLERRKPGWTRGE